MAPGVIRLALIHEVSKLNA